MAGQKVSTGWKGLDSQLGGGLPKGSITAVSGATGSGKSIFALQFLINGIKSSGEPGLYIAIEDSKNTVYRNMSGFGWDLRQYEDSSQLVIIDFPFHEVDQLLDMKNPIKELVDRFGVERAVIDSIMPVAAKFQSESDMKKGFMRMIENIRAWDTTTMITTNECKPADYQTMPQTEFGIERFTDGWIHLHYAPKGGERKRSLEIIKMKGSAHETEAMPFGIKKGGIDI